MAVQNSKHALDIVRGAGAWIKGNSLISMYLAEVDILAGC